MGIKCPKCGSNDTEREGSEMACNNCAHSWKPYKHRGKRMRVIGDGIVFPRKRVMPGARTTTAGDDIFLPKKRIRKPRQRKSDWLGF